MNSSSKNLPEHFFLCSIFMVDETSPSGLRWKTYSKGKRKDLVAGSKTTNKSTGKTYWQVRINNSSYFVHRIVYYLCTQIEPGKYVIDHINGDGTDNQIENLRVVTQQVNSFNHKTYKNNSTGVSGISYIKTSNKYKLTLYFNRKQRHIGYYDSLDQAKIAKKFYMTDEDDINALMPEDLK